MQNAFVNLRHKIIAWFASLSPLQLFLLGFGLFAVFRMLTHSDMSRGILVLMLMFWFVPEEIVTRNQPSLPPTENKWKAFLHSLWVAALWEMAILRRHIFSRALVSSILMIMSVVWAAQQGAISIDAAGISIATICWVIIKDQIVLGLTSPYRVSDVLTTTSK